jgi:hypothetical protein
MGFLRKTLWVGTGGLSGAVGIKANSKKERTAKALEQQNRLLERQGSAAVSALPVADELTKLVALRDQKVITDAEFDAQKRHLLAGQPSKADAKHPVVGFYTLVTVIVLICGIAGYWDYAVGWAVIMAVSIPLIVKHNHRKSAQQSERLTAVTLAQHKAERDAKKTTEEPRVRFVAGYKSGRAEARAKANGQELGKRVDALAERNDANRAARKELSAKARKRGVAQGRADGLERRRAQAEKVVEMKAGGPAAPGYVLTFKGRKRRRAAAQPEENETSESN